MYNPQPFVRRNTSLRMIEYNKKMCTFGFCQSDVFKQEDRPTAAKLLETSSSGLLIPCCHLLE